MPVLDADGEREILRIAQATELAGQAFSKIDPNVVIETGASLEEIDRFWANLRFNPGYSSIVEVESDSRARTAALEAALIRIAGLLANPFDDDICREAASETAQEILSSLGLADRLQGNPDKADEAVS